MNRLLQGCLVLILCLVGARFGHAQDLPEVKPGRLIVMPIDNKGNAPDVVLARLTEAYTQARQTIPGMTLVEREKLGDILNRVRLEEESGAFAAESTAKLGNLVGANYALWIRVTAFQANTRQTDLPYTDFISGRTLRKTFYSGSATLIVEHRLVDLETGKVLRSGTASGKDDQTKEVNFGLQESAVLSATTQVTNGISTSLSGWFPIETTVIQVKNEKDDKFIRIDGGKNRNIRPGSIFALYAISEEKLGNGRVIKEEKLVGYGRITTIGDDWAKLEVGRLEDKKDRPTTQRFKPDTKNLSKITEGAIARSAP